MFSVIRYLLLCFLALVCLVSCARQSELPGSQEKLLKLKADPVAGTYLQFIRSELERYQESPEVSLDAINRAIISDPNVGYFYYQRALIEAGSGQWESVIDDCKNALRLDHGNIDAKILMAKALGVLEKHSDAIKYLNEAMKEAPDREETYRLLAKEYMNIEEYGQAERVMRQLLARDSEAMVAYYYLGAIYGAYMKQPTRAIEVYKRVLEREPENAQVIDAVSQLYLEMDQPAKALELLLDLERQRPNDISLKLKIAQIYYRLKDYPPAVERFEEILKRNPDSDKIMYYLGVMYEESGRLSDAALMFEKVPPKSGLYKDARLRLAFKYKIDGDINSAKDVLEKAIRRQPKIPEFYQYLAGMYERENDYDGAVKILLKATKAFPEDPKLYFALGTLYEKSGDYKRAVEMMRKVLVIDPKHANALNYIGYTIVEQDGDLDEAEGMLQEAAHIKPDDGYIIDSLGWLYFKKGDYTRAFHLLKKALEVVPNEPTVLKHMGEVYLERGETREALKYFRKALDEWQKKETVDEKEVNELVSLIQKAAGGQQ